MVHVRTRENGVILACIALTIGVLVVTHDPSDPPTWVTGAIVILLGVIVPPLINGVLDRRGAHD